MNRKPLFIFLSFLVMISLACSATKNFQSTEEAGNVISPTTSIEIEKVPGALQLGETGENKGLNVLLENYTLDPGCDGAIGFELVLTNISNKPISQFSLSVTDDNGQQFYDIWWSQGSASYFCYDNDSLAFNKLEINPGESIRIAVRVLGDLSADFSYILVSLWSEGVNLLSWQVPAPLAYSLSCEPEKWIITPTAIYEHPQGDGWKLIIVELNLSNQSPYWGEYSNYFNKATVTTEGGYTYSSVVGPMSIPEKTGSPYSNEYINGGQIGGPPMIVGGGVATLGRLPPGFSLSNIVRLDRFSQTPENIHPFSLMFQVAENQTQYTILTNTPAVNCIFPDGSKKYENGQPITLDIQKGFGTAVFPTTVEHSQFLEIPSQLDVPGKGTLEYLGMNRTSFDEYSDLIVLGFQFTNTTGYDAEGKIIGYLVGSDGVATPFGCGNEACTENDISWHGTGYFGAGPGQTFLTDVTFLVSKNTDSLKFIWLGEDGILPSYEVFRIP